MNGLMSLLGIESWKPAVGALLLPPVPLLLLVLVGARLILPRRGLGWFIVILSVALLWLGSCVGTAHFISDLALKPPKPLSLSDIAELKDAARARKPLAIVILGGGAEALAPEYAVANLRAPTLERLRFGMWLNRETGIPMAMSGGVGWAARPDSLAEAQIGARIAAQEFGRPLKWIEDTSRDTRENAMRTVAMLRADGIHHIVLVTHGTHMPRAVKMFEMAAGGAMRIQPAPMGLARSNRPAWFDWTPSTEGFEKVNRILHELAATATGA